MRKGLDEQGLRRIEAYPKGDTARFDESAARQDLASDRRRATPVFRFNQQSIQPAGRTRIPGPSTALRMERDGTDTGSDHSTHIKSISELSDLTPTAHLLRRRPGERHERQDLKTPSEHLRGAAGVCLRGQADFARYQLLAPSANRQ